MTSRLICTAVLLVLFPVRLLGGEAEKDVIKAIKNVVNSESYAIKVVENQAPAIEAKYQKGQPLNCKADQIEFFKKGDNVAYKDGDKWHRSKRGVESDPLRILGGVSKVRTLRLPHEELAGLEKKATQLTKRQGMVYVGDLTPEGVQAFVRTEHKGVAQSGTLEMELSGKGQVIRYTITIRLEGRIGNAEIDGSSTRTVNLVDVGQTRVEVPEGARKALE